MNTIVIRNGCIVTMDQQQSVIPNGMVEVRKDRIVYVGPAFGRPEPDTSATVIDAGGKVVMPGLINGHTHLSMGFGRTVGFELNVMEWINENQYPLMDEMGAHEYYLAVLVGCAENLKNGNTTIVEDVCSSHRDGIDADAATVRAVKEAGIRACLARSYADQNYYPNAVEKRENIVSRCREWIQEYHNSEHGRLKTLIGPVVPWGCSEALYEATIRLKEEFGVRLHMHASESPAWNARGEAVYGLPTNIDILEKFGCLGQGTTVAAIRVFFERDIENLAKTGTNVIHDPTVTLNWGSGFPNIPSLLRAGIRVGLGTNGASSNFGQDLFEGMKNAIGVARTTDGSTTALGLWQALRMVTIQNAQILGIDQEVGSLEAGKKADIIVVNVSTLHHAPCLNVAAALALCSRGSDVEEVIVDGKSLVRQGRLVHIDEVPLIRETYERALWCAQRAGLGDRLLTPMHTD